MGPGKMVQTGVRKSDVVQLQAFPRKRGKRKGPGYSDGKDSREPAVAQTWRHLFGKQLCCQLISSQQTINHSSYSK